MEKEVLIQALDTSKENVTAKVEEKDNEINKAIAEDWNSKSKQIEED